MFGKKSRILELQAANAELQAELELLKELEGKLVIERGKSYNAEKYGEILKLENARLQKLIDFQAAQIENMKKELADKDNRISRKSRHLKESIAKLREKSKIINSQGERLQQTDQEYVWKNSPELRAERYGALGEILRLVEKNLQKNGEVCKLSEIKSGDYVINGRHDYHHIYFKGSTPPSLWQQLINKNYSGLPMFGHYLNDKVGISLKNDEISAIFSKYGEVLDNILYTKYGPDAHILYDGAHYFHLYLENANNLDVKNIVKSYLQEKGLGITSKFEASLEKFQLSDEYPNNFDELMRKENERIDKIKGTANARQH